MQAVIGVHEHSDYLSEETDLTGIGQVAESTGLSEHLNVGLGHLGAGGGDFLHGQEGFALTTPHQVPCRIFAEAGDRDEGGQQLAVLDDEFRGVAVVNADGQEFKAPDVVFVGHFQRGQQVFVFVR